MKLLTTLIIFLLLMCAAYQLLSTDRIYFCKAGDWVHMGVSVTGGAGNEVLIGDNNWIGSTSLYAIKIA